MLYVATWPLSVHAAEASEPKRRSGIGYESQTPDGARRYVIQPPSCGCKKVRELGRLSADAIVEAAKEPVGG